jgi:hypothetical protein
MSESRFAGQINYGAMVERALRGVVRETLMQVAEHGLPGRHHVYITFRTDHPGVEIADSLRERYPTEMTIVLQHEFWGLEVAEGSFSVTLSFNSLPQELEIPFEAITVFADPSVEFGLQFTVPESKKEQPEHGVAEEVAPVAELPRPSARSGPDNASAEVVTLDRFRKK